MTPPPRIGVVGLGRMGGPVARRLAAVFPTVVFDLDETRADAITGAARAGNADAVAADADVLVTVLPAADDVRAALDGGRLFSRMRAGALWLDLSSCDPRATGELADLAAISGVDVAAAPMGGGPREAERGELLFFVGAPEATRPRVLEVLAPLGRAILPFAGEAARDAQLVKLLANGLWFGQAIAVTEALLVARAAGLDAGSVAGILAQSAAGSVFLDRHAPRLLSGDDMPDFGIAGVVEELDNLTALADRHGVPHAVLDLVARAHREALDEFGPVDGELLGARLLERRAPRPLT